MYLPNFLYTSITFVLLILFQGWYNTIQNVSVASTYSDIGFDMVHITSFYIRNLMVTGDSINRDKWIRYIDAIDVTTTENIPLPSFLGEVKIAEQVQKMGGLDWNNATRSFHDNQDISDWNNSLPIIKDILWIQIVALNAHDGYQEHDDKREEQEFYLNNNVEFIPFTKKIEDDKRDSIVAEATKKLFKNYYVQMIFDYVLLMGDIRSRNAMRRKEFNRSFAVVTNILNIMLILIPIIQFVPTV